MKPTRARACQGKQRHATRAAAEQQRQGLIRGGAAPAGLVVYECRRFCGGFHVGHARFGKGRR